MLIPKSRENRIPNPIMILETIVRFLNMFYSLLNRTEEHLYSTKYVIRMI